MEDLAKEIALKLLERGAVRLSPREPFTWASGIKSPIYCDNRLMIAFVEERKAIVQGFKRMIAQLDSQPEVIGGTATAAIPWAAFVAYELDLPMIYIRPQKKEHGAGKQIEGFLPAGKRVLILEDLVSTGGSSIEAAQVVREEGKCEVTDILAIMQYGLPGALERFQTAGIKLDTLTDYVTLASVASDNGFISAEDLKVIEDFQADPAGWYQRNL